MEQHRAELDRLGQEQHKALQTSRTKLEQWKKFKQDYEDLKEKLKSLPDRISYDVQVPFGDVAFMPGKHVRTNEVMVLLGDNWFVQRSCKQAGELVSRRIKQCDDMLEKICEEETNLINWASYTKEMKDESAEFVEILEEYDEEKEKAWRERHRKNVQKFRRDESRKQAELEWDFDGVFSNIDTEEHLENHQEASLQLAEEVFEQAGTNLSTTIPKSSCPSGDGASYNQARRVSWHADPVCNISDKSDDEDDIPQPLRITVKHTIPEKSADSDGEVDSSGSASIQTFASPADIYIHFEHWLKKLPKSILKSSKASPVKENLETLSPESLDTTKELPVVKQLPAVKAVSDNVIERSPTAQQASTSKRAVSRFKSSRQ